MVGKTTLDLYDVYTMTDYYLYIIKEIINGNSKNVTRMIKDMSVQQKKDAICFFESSHHIDVVRFRETVIKQTVELI